MQENSQDEAPRNELDGAAAYILATRLIVIPRFPRDRAAVEKVADWLIDLCEGGQVPSEGYWTPTDRATWLINTAIDEFENWDEGRGLPALRSLYNRKFRPPPELREHKSLGEPPAIDCKLCHDDGTVEVIGTVKWCICEQAILLRSEAPQLIEILQRGVDRRLAKKNEELEAAAAIILRKARYQAKPLAEQAAKSPAEQANEATIRAEIERLNGQRKRDAQNSQLRIGPVSFLRWPRLYRLLRNWTSRILRARTS